MRCKEKIGKRDNSIQRYVNRECKIEFSNNITCIGRKNIDLDNSEKSIFVSGLNDVTNNSMVEPNLSTVPFDDGFIRGPIRENVCNLVERTVALALSIPLDSLRAKTRCSADVAQARQIAMYLCHTTFSILMTEVGIHFNRDRTTVSHACTIVEDKRDEPEFDLIISQLEDILCSTKNVMSICLSHEPRNHHAAMMESVE